MSFPKKQKRTCTRCEKEYTAWIWNNIDLECHPEAYEKFSTRQYFKRYCPHCGTVDYEEHSLLCYDRSRKIFLHLNTAVDWEHYFDLDVLIEEGQCLRRVNSVAELCEKLLALKMGRDDRIVELCKARMLIPLALRSKDFMPVKVWYCIEDGHEMIMARDAHRVKAKGYFRERIYELYEKIFRDVLDKNMPKNYVYDINWAIKIADKYPDLMMKYPLLNQAAADLVSK